MEMRGSKKLARAFLTLPHPTGKAVGNNAYSTYFALNNAFCMRKKLFLQVFQRRLLLLFIVHHFIIHNLLQYIYYLHCMLMPLFSTIITPAIFIYYQG